MQDTYWLLDENGILVVEKNIVSHMKVYVDANPIAEGKMFRLESRLTRLSFPVSSKTTQEEWRRFADEFSQVV